MRSFVFGDSNKAKVAILIKDSYFVKKEIEYYYIKPLEIDAIALSLYYDSNNKCTIATAREYMSKLLPYMTKLGIDTIYVADSLYFKALTKEKKAEKYLGYFKPCAIKDYEHIQVTYGINYAQCLYSTANESKLNLSINCLKQYLAGTTNIFGDKEFNISYSSSFKEYLNEPIVCIDVETTGLDINSEILTIAFGKDTLNAFAIEVTKDNKTKIKRFFELYKGRKVFHNATFDIKMIIKNIFMDNESDYDGLLHGLHTMCNKMHDTKVIKYLATNNTQGNNLGLKESAYEYMGDYAVDVIDCTKLDKETLLEYNAKDVLATRYVYNTFYPLMVQDNQLTIYEDLFLPTLKSIVHIELIGLPVNKDTAIKTNKELKALYKNYLNRVMSNPYIELANQAIKQKELDKYNSSHKKQKTIDEMTIEFNVNSTSHLRVLLYEVMQLPILAYTDTKQPAVDRSTLKKLKHYTDDSIIDALLDYFGLQKVLSTFMPLFVNATARDGWHYLHGNFNATGTVSARLSSNNP